MSDWGLFQIGPIDLADIVRKSSAISFMEAQVPAPGMSKNTQEFRLTFHRSCRHQESCNVSLSGISFAFPLLKVSHAELSPQISFSMFSDADFVLDRLRSDLNESRKFTEKRYQNGVGKSQLLETVAKRHGAVGFFSSPLRVEVRGIRAKGSLMKLPLEGEIRSLTVIPGVLEANSLESLASPIFFKLSGVFSKIFKESVLITESYKTK